MPAEPKAQPLEEEAAPQAAPPEEAPPTEVPKAKQIRKRSEVAKAPAVILPPPPPEPAPEPPPAAAAPASTTYRVWAYGTLQRNGKVYQPGDELALDPAEAAKIPCLERV